MRFAFYSIRITNPDERSTVYEKRLPFSVGKNQLLLASKRTLYALKQTVYALKLTDNTLKHTKAHDNLINTAESWAVRNLQSQLISNSCVLCFLPSGLQIRTSGNINQEFKILSPIRVSIWGPLMFQKLPAKAETTKSQRILLTSKLNKLL